MEKRVDERGVRWYCSKMKKQTVALGGSRDTDAGKEDEKKTMRRRCKAMQTRSRNRVCGYYAACK